MSKTITNNLFTIIETVVIVLLAQPIAANRFEAKMRISIFNNSHR